MQVSQYDNLSCRLEVLGSLPEGWDWAMLVQAEEKLDIIPLTPVEGGVGADLTRDQLAVGDSCYLMQLRGTRGDVVRHTNIIQVFVPRSLSGDGQWPTVPTEFTQLEQRMLELNSHPPIPGQGGVWLLWDVEEDQYKESDLPLPDGAGMGAAVKGGLALVAQLLRKGVYTGDVSALLTELELILDGGDTGGDDTGGDDTGGDDTGGGGSDEPVVTTEVLTFVHSSSRYPDLTTFAYTQVESGGYPLVLPSTIGGGVLSVDFDTSRFVNFQIIMYLFDENGAPYKLIGGGGKKFTGNMDSSGWVEKNPGTAPGWATVAGPFTMNIPDGCNVMMAFQPTGGSSADGSITQTGFHAEVMDNGFIQAKITKEG